MLLAPRPRSTAGDLVRLLACWLALIVFLQCIGAAQALGRGPLHRHVEGSASTHDHHHDAAERHHHAAQDLSVQVLANDPGETIDTGAFALVAALALMALAVARVWRDRRRHVWRPALAWACSTHIPSTLRKPPRQG
jgi:MYXO-CTERM domain-containing protein